MGKSSGGVRGVTAADIAAVTALDINNSLRLASSDDSILHRLQIAQTADKEMQRIMDYIDKNSLAYKILYGADPRRGFTNKQMWVITYELLKNKSFVKQVAAAKKRKAAERKAEAEFYRQNKDIIKANKRRLRQEKAARKKMTQAELREFYRTGKMPPNWQDILKR